VRHEHRWVEVFRAGRRVIYRCDVRNMKGNWRFCGEIGYGVVPNIFPARREDRVRELLANLRMREIS